MSIESRDELLHSPLPRYLVGVLNAQVVQKDLLRICSWVAAGLCRGKPAPDPDLVGDIVKCFGRLLLVQDQEIVSAVLSALFSLTDGSEPLARMLVIDNVPIEELVDLAEDEDPGVGFEALRVLGNMCAGTTDQVDKVLLSGGLHVLQRIIANKDYECLSALKEACWIVSNIAAGPPAHVQQIVGLGLAKTFSSIIHSAKTPASVPAGCFHNVG